MADVINNWNTVIYNHINNVSFFPSSWFMALFFPTQKAQAVKNKYFVICSMVMAGLYYQISVSYDFAFLTFF